MIRLLAVALLFSFQCFANPSVKLVGMLQDNTFEGMGYVTKINDNLFASYLRHSSLQTGQINGAYLYFDREGKILFRQETQKILGNNSYLTKQGNIVYVDYIGDVETFDKQGHLLNSFSQSTYTGPSYDPIRALKSGGFLTYQLLFRTVNPEHYVRLKYFDSAGNYLYSRDILGAKSPSGPASYMFLRMTSSEHFITRDIDDEDTEASTYHFLNEKGEELKKISVFNGCWTYALDDYFYMICDQGTMRIFDDNGSYLDTIGIEYSENISFGKTPSGDLTLNTDHTFSVMKANGTERKTFYLPKDYKSDSTTVSYKISFFEDGAMGVFANKKINNVETLHFLIFNSDGMLRSSTEYYYDGTPAISSPQKDLPRSGCVMNGKYCIFFTPDCQHMVIIDPYGKIIPNKLETSSCVVSYAELGAQRFFVGTYDTKSKPPKSNDLGYIFDIKE